MSSVSDGGYRYRLVDVFTQEPFEGNQLAVFPDARGLDDASMQSIARELNLPEVTFVFPASLMECVADVRIFTPAKEMRFAGHPTLGTAFILRDEGLLEPSLLEFRLQEKVGPVPVLVDNGSGLLWLQTPEIHWGGIYDPPSCAEAVGLKATDLADGISPQRLSAGNPTLFIPVRDRSAVDRAWLGPEGMRLLRDGEPEPFCVFVFAPTTEGAYSRMFAPDYGIPEDPATGSATGPLAAYMKKHGLTAGHRFVSEQGTKMGRRSFLHVQIRSTGDIEVGGHVTPIGEGRLQLARARRAA
jgi:trans-2,3-dihydro-3-hydroxyanthranilate isomerase